MTVNVGRFSTSSSQHTLIRSNTARPMSDVAGNVGRNGILSPLRTRLTASDDEIKYTRLCYIHTCNV